MFKYKHHCSFLIWQTFSSSLSINRFVLVTKLVKSTPCQHNKDDVITFASIILIIMVALRSDASHGLGVCALLLCSHTLPVNHPARIDITGITNETLSACSAISDTTAHVHKCALPSPTQALYTVGFPGQHIQPVQESVIYSWCLHVTGSLQGGHVCLNFSSPSTFAWSDDFFSC